MKAIEIKGVNKNFGVVKALKDIHLDIYEGETMALVGENGAGKSTLMKILTGAYQKSSGKICIYGKEAENLSPAQAKKMGIGQVYQRAELIPELSVAENIMLGESGFSKKGIVRHADHTRIAQELLNRYGIDVNPEEKVGHLSSAMGQLVAIAKVMLRNPRIIIFDEPTAVLSDKEVNILFSIIRQLRREKKTIIYISHRLEELFQICDRVTVMRDGAVVTTMPNKNLTKEAIVEQMLGKAPETGAARNKARAFDETVLELRNVSTRYIRNVSFCLYKGEILGIAGLVNSGRTETARAIYGVDKIESGEILYYGESIRMKSPQDAVQRGLFLAPEDRRKESMVLCRPIRENVSLSNLSGICKNKIIRMPLETERVNAMCADLNVKTDTIEAPVQNLSGGNQQKIVVAKALTANPRILIFDEPTQGIDVGAKAEIYQLLEKLQQRGLSIIVISSELEELQRLCDRIVVMHDFGKTGEVEADRIADTEQILNLMYRSVDE